MEQKVRQTESFMHSLPARTEYTANMICERQEVGIFNAQASQGSELVLFTPINKSQDEKAQPSGMSVPRICHSPKPQSPTSPSSVSLPTSPLSSAPGLSESNANTFEVRTLKANVESGFSYHQRLFEYRIPPADWKQFSDELVAAFALTTSEKIAAWTVGVSVGLVSAVPLLVFGAAPGYYAGKAVNSMSIESKVHDYLKDEGELVTVLRRWNNTFFKSKGLRVKLALPKGKMKEASRSGTFDSFIPFGSKRKGKGKGKGSSQDGDDGGETDKKEVKKLHKRYRLIIEVVGTEPKEDPVVEFYNDNSLPKDKMELESSDGLSAVPTYSPGGPPPYKSGMHPAELEPASASQAAELEGGPRDRVPVELEGSSSPAELPAALGKQPVYELA